MGRLGRFIAICALVFVAGMAGLAVLVATVDMGLSRHGIAAMFLGAAFTLLLGMGLMGLVFFGDRAEDGAGGLPREREERRGPKG